MNKLVEQMGIAELVDAIAEYDENFPNTLIEMFTKEKLVEYYTNVQKTMKCAEESISCVEFLDNLKSIVIDFYKKELGVE